MVRFGAVPLTDLEPGDAQVAAIVRGERPETPLPAELDPNQQEAVILAALDGRLELVVELLRPGFFGHVGGGPPGTLLHHACWVGNARIVERLLMLGADPVARSGAEDGVPLAWTVIGSQYHRVPGRDYVAVAEHLFAGGAALESRFIELRGAHWPTDCRNRSRLDGL